MMRRAALLLAVLAICSIAALPSRAEVLTYTDAEQATLSFTLLDEGLLPARTIAFRCEGPDVLVSTTMLNDEDLGEWFGAGGSVALEIDGDQVADGAIYDLSYSNWSGWTANIVMHGEAGWLERMPAAEEARITLPSGAFTLPATAEATAELAVFVSACEAARFGGAPVARPDASAQAERAVLYEPSRCERCVIYLETITTPATVRWQLETDGAGTRIVAEIAVSDRGLLALAIAPSTTREGAFDIDLDGTIFVKRDYSFDPGAVAALAVTDNVTDREMSEQLIDPFTVSTPRRSTSRNIVEAFDLRRLAGGDLIEFLGVRERLVLELGDTGRAAFAEAFAAWGMAR